MSEVIRSICLVLILIFGISITSAVYAQSNETIRSGRPGQAIGAYVVGTGYFQIQSGLDHAWTSGSADSASDLSSNVFRYGLTESFELSSVVNYQTDTGRSVTTKSGFSGVQLGFRYNIVEKPNGWIPGLAVQTRFRMTTVSSDYRYAQVAPIIVVATNHHLSDAVSLTTNWGMVSDGNTAVPTYTFVGNLSFPLTETLGGFAEIYGNSRDAVGSNYLDAGVAYLVSNDLQLDIYGGFGSNRGIEESFASVGISWRTKAR